MTKMLMHSAKWQRMVKKIKARKNKVNPYAVATARLGRKKSFVKYRKES